MSFLLHEEQLLHPSSGQAAPVGDPRDEEEGGGQGGDEHGRGRGSRRGVEAEPPEPVLGGGPRQVQVRRQRLPYQLVLQVVLEN